MTVVQLPVRDILHCQRVSKQFKGAIESSPKIARALFFENDSAVGASRWCGPVLFGMMDAGTRMLDVLGPALVRLSENHRRLVLLGQHRNDPLPRHLRYTLDWLSLERTYKASYRDASRDKDTVGLEFGFRKAGRVDAGRFNYGSWQRMRIVQSISSKPLTWTVWDDPEDPQSSLSAAEGVFNESLAIDTTFGDLIEAGEHIWQGNMTSMSGDKFCVGVSEESDPDSADE